MIFYVLTFAIAWSMWALAGRFADGASLTATGRIIFAVGFMAAVKLTAAVVIRVSTGAWPGFGTEPILIMIAALIVSTWTQAGEELGWRGFALPQLAGRMGVGPASIVIGVIWAVWHLPLFYAPYSDTYGQSFPLYLSQVVGISVAMGWLYWRTNGSLILVMLLHAAVNNTANIVPSRTAGATDAMSFRASAVGWTSVAVLWVAAAFLLYHMRMARDAETSTVRS